MRLLPRNHALRNDWLAHAFSISFAGTFALLTLIYQRDANLWPLALQLPLFILLYYRGFWQGSKGAVGHFLAMLTLGVWAMSLHWSGTWLMFSGQLFLLKIDSRRLFIALWIVHLFAQQMALIWFEYSTVLQLLLFLYTFLGAPFTYLFFRHQISERRLLVQQEELEYLSRQNERERIARDLHDVLGHKLSSIALKAELAEKLLQAERHDQAGKELAEIAETARTALADVRQTVTGYRSGNLRSELVMAAHSLANAGIDAEMPTPESLPKRISRELENLLSLVLREAITNVIRHAQAQHCHVQFFNRKRNWHLIITDNGIGWRGHFGNGLTGMKERLALHDGRITVKEMSPGTQVRVVVEQLIEGDVDETH